MHSAPNHTTLTVRVHAVLSSALPTLFQQLRTTNYLLPSYVCYYCMLDRGAQKALAKYKEKLDKEDDPAYLPANVDGTMRMKNFRVCACSPKLP